jgi:hypothetical protein
MRKRSGTPQTNSSGFVPMADMLSNTVGIMIFILAFTVLQTGGVLIPKRLPMERKTDQRPAFYVCWNQRLIPLDAGLSESLFNGLDKPTYHTVGEWISKFNKSRAEDQFFTVLPKGEVLYDRNYFQSRAELILVAEYQPKENIGDTFESVEQGNSLFDKDLQNMSTSEKFVYFLVYPCSIDLFRKVREYTTVRHGFSTGWNPVSTGEPIRFSLNGGTEPRPD